MHKGFLKAGASIGALSVILGAFAAHALKEKLSADELAIFETAVKYQFYHGIALLIVGILYKEFRSKKMEWAGRLFILGIIMFSGSLYLLAYLKSTGVENLKAAGIITPIGGLMFILGWVFLLRAVFEREAKIEQ